MDAFEQLSQKLNYIYNADEREILLEAMARVGSLEQLTQKLDYIYNAGERKIVFQGIAEYTQQLAQGTKEVAGQTKGTRLSLERSSKPAVKRYDIFIAHASEDKNFVTPLAISLKQRGLEVWYDDFIFKLGDSLHREIDRGLAQSRYGVVILSHNFFNKNWTLKELDGLAAKERLGKKVIIPVWYNIDKEGIEYYSPTLAGIYAAKSSLGVETVAKKIMDAILAK